MASRILKILLYIVLWYVLEVLMMSVMMSFPSLRANSDLYGIIASVISAAIVAGIILLRKRSRR